MYHIFKNIFIIIQFTLSTITYRIRFKDEVKYIFFSPTTHFNSFDLELSISLNANIYSVGQSLVVTSSKVTS